MKFSNEIQLFKDPNFHYREPKNDTITNDCVIHSINHIAQTVIFKSREDFFKLYITRKKHNKNNMYEDILARGITLRNLKRMLYDSEEDCFYDPFLSGGISKDEIDCYVKNALPVIELIFVHCDGNGCII